MIWLASSANSPSKRATDFARLRPSDSFFVRLLASLLLIRLAAFALRRAVRRVLKSRQWRMGIKFSSEYPHHYCQFCRRLRSGLLAFLFFQCGFTRCEGAQHGRAGA